MYQLLGTYEDVYLSTVLITLPLVLIFSAILFDVIYNNFTKHKEILCLK